VSFKLGPSQLMPEDGGQLFDDEFLLKGPAQPDAELYINLKTAKAISIRLFRCLLDRQFGRLLALEDTAGITAVPTARYPSADSLNRAQETIVYRSHGHRGHRVTDAPYAPYADGGRQRRV
jgi:hypothetical protein